MTIEVPEKEDDHAYAEVYIVTAGTGVYHLEASRKGGCGLAWQVGDKAWITDRGVSCRMSCSPDQMTNYHECDKIVRAAGGGLLPIE